MENRTLKKKIILILTILLFVSKLLADDCGIEILCPNISYPYIFCNPITGEYVIACVKGDPNGVSVPGYPDVAVNKIKLPICQGRRWWARDTPVNFYEFEINPNAQQKMLKGPSGNGPVVLQSSKMLDEFDEACET